MARKWIIVDKEGRAPVAEDADTELGRGKKFASMFWKTMVRDGASLLTAAKTCEVLLGNLRDQYADAGQAEDWNDALDSMAAGLKAPTAPGPGWASP